MLKIRDWSIQGYSDRLNVNPTSNRNLPYLYNNSVSQPKMLPCVYIKLKRIIFLMSKQRKKKKEEDSHALSLGKHLEIFLDKNFFLMKRISIIFLKASNIRTLWSFPTTGCNLWGNVEPVGSLHCALDLLKLNWKCSWSSVEVTMWWNDSKA